MSLFGGGAGSGLFGTQTPSTGLGLGTGLGSTTGGGLGTGLGASGGTGLFGNTSTATGQSGGSLFGGQNLGLGTGTLGGGTGLGGGGTLFGTTPSSQAGGTGLFGNTGAGLGGGGLFQTPGTSSGLRLGGTSTAGVGGGGGLFGTTPGLGGGTATTNTGFSTPLFNQTSTAGGMALGGLGLGVSTGGGLGLTGLSSGVMGTPIKFEPMKGYDTAMKNNQTQSVTTNLQCICGMKQYENKGMEELRLEDYLANRKGSSVFSGAKGGLLGAGATGGSVFGQAGQSIGGALGTGGLFGNQARTTTTGSLFGNQAKPGVGSGLTAATSLGQTGGMFGGGLGTAGGGLGTAGGGGLFGATTSQGTGLGLGGLGTQGQLGILGNKTGVLGTSGLVGGLQGGLGAGGGLAGGLGTGLGLGTGTLGLQQPSQQQGGIFNRTQQGGLGKLGQTNGLGLGQGTGLQLGALGAGQSTQLGTGLNLTSGGGMLGLNQSKLGTAGLGLGGTSTGLSLGLGGGLTGNGALGTQNLGQANQEQQIREQQIREQQIQLQTFAIQQQRQAQLQQQLQMLAQSPFGDSPLFRTAMSEAVKPKPKEPVPVAPKTSVASSPHYKLNIRPSHKLRPVSFSSPALRKDREDLFKDLDDSPLGTETFVPRHSVKKLVIKPKEPSIHPSSIQPATTTTTTTTTVSHFLSSPSLTTMATTDVSHSLVSRPAFSVTPSSGPQQPSDNESVESPDFVLGMPYTNPVRKPIPRRPTPTADNTMDELGEKKVSYTSSHLTLDEPSVTEEPTSLGDSSATLTKVGVILTREDYYTVPPISELQRMVEEGRSEVEDLVIGRKGCGEILFPGTTDVNGLDLDYLVTINPKEASVYPEGAVKPPQGEGLNKRAQIRLDGYWPICKTTRQPIHDPQRLAKTNYVGMLKKKVAQLGAVFVDYIPDTGSCIFRVEHFSKYKLVADDDSESEGEEEKGKKGDSKRKKVTEDSEKGKKIETIGSIQSDTTRPLPMGPGLFGQTVGQVPPNAPTKSALGDEDEVMSDVDSVESFQPILPSSHQMANQLGVDTHQVQIMKASFFGSSSLDQDFRPKPPPQPQPRLRVTAGTGTSSRMAQQLPGQGLNLSFSSSPYQRSLDDSFRRRECLRSAISVSPQSSLRPQLHPVPQSHTRPTIVLPKKNLDRLVPMAESISNSKTGLLADHGLILGRSFRVGWGPNWTLAHSGAKIAQSKSGSSPVHQPVFNTSLMTAVDGKDTVQGVKFRVLVEKVDASPWMKAELVPPTGSVKSMYEPFLRAQLDYSKSVIDSDEQDMPDVSVVWVPQWAPTVGQGMLSALKEACLNLPPDGCEMGLKKQFQDVFKLVTALWGSDRNDEESAGSSSENLMRRRLLSQWFADVCGSAAIPDKPPTSSGGSDDGYLSSLYNLLTQFRLAEACQLCHKHRDHRLALLLAQAASGIPDNRNIVGQQLIEWAKLKSHHQISPVRMLIFMLLAGVMTSPWEGMDTLNTCSGLDWRRAFGLHLWYASPPSNPISEILELYNEAFQDAHSYASPPFPMYTSSLTTAFMPEEQDQDSVMVLDTCYHLLELYCNHDYTLGSVLLPSGSTPYQLDYRLSWHLWGVLTSLQLRPAYSWQTAYVHCSYSSQLVASGAWQWAVFVVMHLSDAELRQKQVVDILSQHCCADEELREEEKFVVERLGVPKMLVYQAKAQAAEHQELHDVQACHLLRAELWNDAHNIIMTHLAAPAIINDETQTLRDWLMLLSKEDHVVGIQEWSTRGSVYLDFLMISQKLEELDEARDLFSQLGLHELEDIHSGLRSVCARVGQLPSCTPEQCLCQAEMAKRSAGFLRTVIKFKGFIRGDAMLDECSEMVSIVRNLPMPEEFVRAEIRQLSCASPILAQS